LLLPIDDPIFLNTVPGVEFEFDFFVSLFVLFTGREHFDHEFWGDGEVSGLVNAGGEAIAANSNDIGNDGIGGGENDAWGLEGFTQLGLS
jgi:hypothetical protein